MPTFSVHFEIVDGGGAVEVEADTFDTAVTKAKMLQINGNLTELLKNAEIAFQWHDEDGNVLSDDDDEDEEEL